MNIRPLLLSCLIALVLPACEKIDKEAEEQAEQAAAEIKPIPSEKYDKDGLVFEYPTGWNVIDDSTQDDVRYVFIESSDGAVSVIQVFNKEQSPTLEQFATSYSEQTQIVPTLAEGETAESAAQVIAPTDLMSITRDLDGKTYDWIVESVPGEIGGIATSDYREYFRKDSERFSAFLINQVNNDVLTANEGSFELIFRTLTPAE
ncbi:hypothetical protein [Leucothrix arctica]|uniref:PsbP C-terminal domain-containing protein n=1 Tax=Leucothrix arctica TaxID=1481894 RepID=A0A317CIM8_9GAMM|nr:hypothetical protein [Leucothrix arctica]PWQ98418.1 hypothetical protein DKT75_04655 [Leucothrix arctica]